MTKHEELWNKIRNSIRSITNNSDNYDEKYMKIRFNADSDLFFMYNFMKATGITHNFS